MKYSTKAELLKDIELEHQRFVELVETLPKRELSTAGVWGDDWSVKDLLIHLTVWEQMFLRWYRSGLRGEETAVPEAGYKWSDTPRLNRDIQRRFRRKSVVTARREFDASFVEIVEVARGISAKTLFTPKLFPWTRKNPLISYLSANTSSHYRTAQKMLKRWLRQRD